MRNEVKISLLCARCGDELDIDSRHDKAMATSHSADDIAVPVYIRPCYSCMQKLESTIEGFVYAVEEYKKKRQ